MKKLNNIKWFILGMAVCVLVSQLVVPALAASFTKQATLNYSDIKITLNGIGVVPKDANGIAVEPFAIDGTTYLPVRAISNALGLGVDWDQATSTVKLTGSTNGGDSVNFVKMLGFYKRLESKFDGLMGNFNLLHDDIQWVMTTKLTEGPFAGRSLCSASKETLEADLALVESEYAGCKAYLTEDGHELMAEYRRITKLAISYYTELDNNPSTAFINRVVGAGIENSIASDMGRVSALILFWETYDNAIG